MPRPLTRLRLVLPALKEGDARAAPTAEALGARIADALAVHGVQVRQQVQGTPPDGAPRADVALWLPCADGASPTADPRTAPARVHAAFVVEPGAKASHLARFDALVVPDESLRDPVRAALRKASARDVPVIVARLPGAPLVSRDAEKALRGVAGKRVIMVDVRGAEFEGDIERIVVQLALRQQECAIVLLVPHDERARARTRTLCERHAVDAWLASGLDGFSQSIAAADSYFGRPTWDELLLAALHRVAVAWLPVDGARALLEAMQGKRLVEEVMGMLQMAAALDRKLADAGGLDAKGIALREALFDDLELSAALAALEPLPHGALAASLWEAVGPHAQNDSQAVVVDARDPHAPAEVSRGQKVEDALEALKQKIAKESSSSTS